MDVQKNKMLSFGLMFTLFILTSCQNKENTNLESLTNAENVLNAKADQEILLNLLENENYLIQRSALGFERASTSDLKEFSLKTKDIHQKNYDKIKLICLDRGYILPEKFSKNYKNKLYKLTMTNDADFDNYYYQSIVEDYKTNLDSIAKLMNTEKLSNSFDVLLNLEADYTKNLEKAEQLKVK